jgi:hypothetical protein
LALLKGFPQFGGGSTYDFLNLTSSARVNALGGTQVGIIDSTELSLSFYNPATLMPGAHNHLSLNYINYISDINIGYVSYARKVDNVGTFAAGLHYLNFGKFEEALENGELTGNTFTAADYALNLIYSRNIWNNFTAGINVKPIYSAYETYSSFGIAADLGLSYIDSAGLFSAGLVFKNMGTQITAYQYLTEDEYEPLPFDIQFGFSQKLAHAPLRFSVTLNQLHNWKLTDKSTWDYDHKDSLDNVSGNSDDIVRQFMRHVILGVEFVPSKNFSVALGYNYQRKRELSVASAESNFGVGLSGGVNVKISKFRLSYAIARYHLSGTTNTVSVSFNLSEFR